MPWWMIAVMVVAAIAAVVAWWWIPKREVASLHLKVRDPKARADVEDNLRKTMGQLIGGAAVLLGAGLAYYQTQQTLNVTVAEAERSRKVSEEQSLRSVQAARDLLISQQVSKGFENLGNKEIVVRLGGIYALEGVMNAPEQQYHEPVLEALCAFVRDRTRAYAGDGPPATDIQATLTVIGRRKSGKVDLANSHLQGANLFGSKLTGAQLSNANLSRANLRDAQLDYASLFGADLTRAFLDGANMRVAFLDGANLSTADLRADLTSASVSHANLSHTNLFGALLGHADLTGTNLTGANLSAAVLAGADLTGAVLDGANLSAIDLREAKVSQDQLDTACGSSSEMKLPPGLTIKPCPSPASPSTKPDQHPSVARQPVRHQPARR